LLQVYADDAESEVVRAEEGDTFQVGHRSVTVVRVGTDPDGVLLGIVDPEDTPAPDGSPSRRPTAEPEPETEDAFGGNQRSGRACRRGTSAGTAAAAAEEEEASCRQWKRSDRRSVDWPLVVTA